jgi:D,D-heptose 1,7-bisphosphate phosphatase
MGINQIIMENKAVFLDRDGVINNLIYHIEAGIIDSPFTIGQFHLLPGVAEAIHRLNKARFKVLVVSNQPGVAKGHLSLDVLREMTDKMHHLLKQRNAFIDKVYYCLHHPEGIIEKYRTKCHCRKPEPGMLLQACEEFSLSLKNSIMIGDNLSDMLAGQRAGCTTILIGNNKCETCKLGDEMGIKPYIIARDLQAAVETILD